MKVIKERLINIKPILFGDIIESINFDKYKNSVSLKRKIEEFIQQIKNMFEIEYECHELMVYNMTDTNNSDLKILILTEDFQKKYNLILKEVQILVKKFITKLISLSYSSNQIDFISKLFWKNLHVNLIEPLQTELGMPTSRQYLHFQAIATKIFGIKILKFVISLSSFGVGK